MGYYTRYKLEIFDDSQDSFVQSQIAQGKTAEDIYEETMGHNPFGEECKWYSWPDDMETFSKKYPKTIWLLSGEGEDSGDVWRSYHRNGKDIGITAVLVWPEFNPAELSD